MPNIKSASKRVRTAQNRRIRNAHIKSTLRTYIRKFEEAANTAGQVKAQLELRRALTMIDKAVTKGVLHKNTAARRKSRLTKKYNKVAG